MKILVTGAAGFLGARLVEVLLEGGHRVLGVDVLDGEDPPGWQAARLEWARAQARFGFERADVTEPGALDRLAAGFVPETVVHLASRGDLDWAEDAPQACLQLHLGGALEALGVCRRRNIGALVLGSSAHVYGGARRFPLQEGDPCDRPLGLLGVAHRAAELAAHAFALRSPVHTTVVRLFSLYGPRQSPRRLVPALAAAAERRAGLPVYGDGTAGRDLLHVDDAVIGLLRILDRPAPWRLLNLASGESTTLGQVAEQIAWAADVVLRFEHRPPRPGELPQSWADIAAAREAVGFAPAVPLEEGLRRFMQWHRQRPDAFRAAPAEGGVAR